MSIKVIHSKLKPYICITKGITQEVPPLVLAVGKTDLLSKVVILRSLFTFKSKEYWVSQVSIFIRSPLKLLQLIKPKSHHNSR